MRTINIKGGFKALVDDEDFEWLSRWKWQAKRHEFTTYAVRTVYKEGRRVPLKMHRAIMNVTDSKILIDHIDLNGLNNQRSNLRICNKSQNNVNRRSKKNATSKYLGVYFDKARKLWAARTTKNNKSVALGRYKTEREAAIAYNIGAEKIHGEFVNKNNV